jgi:hypothetical protein
MTEPSYHKRLMLLEELLADGARLFKMLQESEEQLREQLIAGDYQELMESDKERSFIQQHIASLEERRKSLVPEGTGLQKYILTTIQKSRQADLLVKLSRVTELLKQIKVHHEVNKVLMEERLRFSRELQESLLEARLTYDERGQLKNEDKGPAKNLDRNC